MASHFSSNLRAVVDEEIAALRAITGQAASNRPVGGWSQKEELGHLIDSAANNHARFVRACLESPYRGPSYDQAAWVRLNAYHDLPWEALTELWYRYNTLLAHLVERIPEDRLDTQCFIGSTGPVTLRFVIEDYVRHLRHHVDHIIQRELVTAYPAAV